MDNIKVPPNVLQHLEGKLQIMTQAMVSGDPVTVAQTYANNALLTDLKGFQVEGREAIDQHWVKLPRYIDWQLRPLKTGGDAETPYQHLHSVAYMAFKGQIYVDEGSCFVVWKRQADGDYRIQVDIYHQLKFGPSE